ncbi:B12-binding domain-containing radical SAM protein [Umezawaea sp. Da 62-37]|uniref:B12-binding domain-containing radical SAM protein n=1 Tax=Umezawaea sp. Da 62-37 TaxID=3075927 RepID=UPI0028F70B11|nr:radical SAM protein [Umezawaea sp. Da 62-37]WNV85800.1 radical SAM protein [Umezawaea sp. Da 62-37]
MSRSLRCLLIEVTAMPGVGYSPILGYLQAAAQTSPEVARRYRFDKRVVYQDVDLASRIPALLDDVGTPDVVALAVYFWNRSISLAIAAEAKRRWPRCLVVLGGNEVSHQTGALLRDDPAGAAVDVLVHGEGEETFRAVLEAVAGLRPNEGVPGISYREAGEIRTTAPAQRIADLATIPSPLLSGVYPDAVIADSKVIILETNRGCPFSCAFCYWGGATKSKVRTFPLDRVKREITHIVTHARSHATLFLADANFGMLPRDVEIARWLVDELDRHDKQLFLFTNWAKNTDARVLEIARILYSRRLIAAVTLSAQSFSTEVLRIANRRNIKPAYYRRLQEQFREMGVPTYTELIWGLPGESREEFLDGVHTVIDSGGFPVVYPLLLLNNTEYTTTTFRAEHEVRTRALPYQFTHREMLAEFVVGHTRMTPEDWAAGMDFRLSLALFHACLLRPLLWYLEDRCGVRVVDACALLVDHLRDGCADPVVRALAANHHDCWQDPAVFDRELVDAHLPADAIPEHPHYQAILRHLAVSGGTGAFVTAAAGHLRAVLPAVAALPSDEFGQVVAFQRAVAEAFARCVTGEVGTVDVGVPPWLTTLLAAKGQLAADQSGASRVRWDLSGFAGVPVDSFLLAVYHGSVHLPMALRGQVAAAERMTS